MLCYWNGFCRRWDSGSLLQDITIVLPAPDFQLRALVSTAIWIDSLSKTPGP